MAELDGVRALKYSMPAALLVLMGCSHPGKQPGAATKPPPAEAELAAPAKKPVQITFDELQMCARDLRVYRSTPEKAEQDKPPKPTHTSVEGMHVGETAYVVALDSWDGKIYVLGSLDAYWQPTVYEGTNYNVGIRRTKAGIEADCSTTPFVIVDDKPQSGDYLPVVGQFNLREEQRAREAQGKPKPATGPRK